VRKIFEEPSYKQKRTHPSSFPSGILTCHRYVWAT